MHSAIEIIIAVKHATHWLLHQIQKKREKRNIIFIKVWTNSFEFWVNKINETKYYLYTWLTLTHEHWNENMLKSTTNERDKAGKQMSIKMHNVKQYLDLNITTTTTNQQQQYGGRKKCMKRIVCSTPFYNGESEQSIGNIMCVHDGKNSLLE